MAIKLRKPIQINPVDVSDRTAVGIKLPFNKKTIFSLDYSTKDHIRSKLLMLLTTSPGERLNQPTYGAGLKNKLFVQNSIQGAEEIKEYIKPQVQIFIPEIEIEEVKISDGGVQGQTFFVTVIYKILNNESEDSVSVSFTNETFQSNY